MKTFEKNLSTDTVMNAGMLLVGIVWVVFAAFQGPLNLPADGPAADVAGMTAPAAVTHAVRLTADPARAARSAPDKIS